MDTNRPNPEYEQLINSLIENETLKTPEVIEAFKLIDRKNFVKEEFLKEAYIDTPLPISKEATISQPTTVAFMLELLDVEPGHNILDVGSGSGWQSTILSYLVGSKGKVCALEKDPELKIQGENNANKYDIGNLTFLVGDGYLGIPQLAPFDRIIVAATARQTPPAILDQLQIGGTLVIPIEDSVYKITKTGKDSFEEKKYPGFAFVPLT